MKSLIALIPLGFMLTGCLMTREQIRGGARGAGSEGQSQITQMQVKRAEQQARIDELEETVRGLRGQIEVVENQVQIMREAESNQAQKAEGQMTSEEIGKQFQLFEEALRSIEGKVNRLNRELQNLKRKPSAKAKSSAKKLGNYGGAEKDFSNKKWKEAIVGYEKYRELNPSGRMYPDATYKIGVCFQELGMSSEAKSFYEEVLAKFPKSSTAKKAKYRLSKLK